LQELWFDLYQRIGWYPKADVYRCADGWLVKLELAGVTPQDIRISLEQDHLVVEGRRRDWCVAETQTCLSMEISYDWFRRAIPLPGQTDSANLRTEFRQGMLLIHLHDRSKQSHVQERI
jgi:HSP20 family protein